MPTSPEPVVTAKSNPPSQLLLSNLTVVTATRLETWVARRALPRHTKVVEVGVGTADHLPAMSEPIISCGLAGALSAELLPGTIVIPTTVGLASGESIDCDPDLVTILVAAAQARGIEPVTAPMLTAPSLVTGPTRAEWAARGYRSVDMESGLLLRRHRGAVVRVVLDTPERELAAEWETPWHALTTPRLWPEAARLAVAAPRYARLAAAVVAAALAI